MTDQHYAFETGTGKIQADGDATKWIIGAIIALILCCCCSISSSLSSGLGYKWITPKKELDK
jgi:hypothetical protein